MMLTAPLFAAISLLLPVSVNDCAGFKRFQTEINVSLDVGGVKYDYSRSKLQLNDAGRAKSMGEWQDKQGDGVWSEAALEISGYTHGAVNITSNIRFRADPYDGGRYFCPYIQSVNIDVTYDAKIFIAKEFKKSSCMFEAVKAHEAKHHTANLKAVYSVVDKLKKDMPKIVKAMESKSVLKANVDARFSDMKLAVREAIEIYNDILSNSMKKSNQAIDTIEEYDRVNAQCK